MINFKISELYISIENDKNRFKSLNDQRILPFLMMCKDFKLPEAFLEILNFSMVDHTQKS